MATYTALRCVCLDYFAAVTLPDKRIGADIEQGLFYTLMLTTANRLLECRFNTAALAQRVTEDSNATAIHREFKVTPQPLLIPNSSDVVSFSMSNTHVAAALFDGTVLTWGDGRGGALGLEDHLVDLRLTSPVPVISLKTSITQVACGIDFTLMLSKEGKVLSCGRGDLGKLGHGDEVDKPCPTVVRKAY